MASRPKGEVKVREWKSGRGYALRFWAYGERQYLTLGFERDGWDRARAEEELQNVLADVRRGIWVPPKKKKARRREAGEDGREVPPFGAFARRPRRRRARVRSPRRRPSTRNGRSGT